MRHLLSGLRRALSYGASECLQHPLTLLYLYKYPVRTLLCQLEKATVPDAVAMIVVTSKFGGHFSLQEFELAVLWLEVCFMIVWVATCWLRWLWPWVEPYAFQDAQDAQDYAQFLEHREDAVRFRRARALVFRLASVLTMLLIRFGIISIYVLIPLPERSFT